MLDRIKKIMEKENLSPSKFAEAIGIQRSAMSHILSERNKPSLEVITKILDRFTYVNPAWMLSGKGEMFTTISSSREPDLFSNTLIKPNIDTNLPENRKEIEVKLPQNTIQQPVKEQIVYKESPAKRITKIMVFYSDDTFDTFTSEKNKKD
ncbi:helix-turn-helix transcriptional regulator [Parabacteroides sp. PF5-9]|uniref:helix-turn-helix domain-containing protein n=1 Tax=Parabacteroides sp. PF5-9 TaxID=1742404 RepID=UPI002473E4F3|nr:helix-turn-helix transcriptional regulator [Parabacteroides sp. PF5-9]